MSHKEYMREWYKKGNNAEKTKERVRLRKEKCIAWWKEHKKTISQCRKCGETDWRCIDYHHINPDDKSTARGGVSQCPHRGWSIGRMLKEIAKCEPICVNCHRTEHISDAPKNKGIQQRRLPPEDLSAMSKSLRYYWKNQEKLINAKNKRISETIKWYQDLKTSMSCSKCNEKRYQCLDFHHTEQHTMMLSDMIYSYTKATIISEITKCELLCGNCHRIHHYYLDNNF